VGEKSIVCTGKFSTLAAHGSRGKKA
jgi:hypothetical protein